MGGESTSHLRGTMMSPKTLIMKTIMLRSQVDRIDIRSLASMKTEMNDEIVTMRELRKTSIANEAVMTETETMATKTATKKNPGAARESTRKTTLHLPAAKTEIE